MPLYENIFIARQDATAAQAEALTETFTNIITEQGGQVAKIEYWGLRNLTYRIKKNRKGHYSLLAIDAPAAAVKEMERQLRINEDVLRYLTVRVDELEEGPSPMLARATIATGPAAATGTTVIATGRAVSAAKTSSAAARRRAHMSDECTADPAAARGRRRRRGPPPVLPPPQGLPVLRRQRAEDRLQGRQAPAALRLRARQDRAVAHHRGLGQEATRTGQGHQARPLPALLPYVVK